MSPPIGRSSVRPSLRPSVRPLSHPSIRQSSSVYSVATVFLLYYYLNVVFIVIIFIISIAITIIVCVYNVFPRIFMLLVLYLRFGRETSHISITLRGELGVSLG